MITIIICLTLLVAPQKVEMKGLAFPFIMLCDAVTFTGGLLWANY